MKNLKIIFFTGLILIIIFSVFLPCLKNDFVALDDSAYITEIISLRHTSLQSIKYIFTSFFLTMYQPLNRVSYLFESKFFGLNPFPYHLANVILHLINCLFVFWLIYLLSGKIAISSIATILFAIHPLRVEPVAWVSGRQDLLCALFFLLTIIYYCYYLRGRKINKYYYFSLVLFIFSLLSKAMAVTLPVILIFVDYLFHRKPDKKMFLDKVPFFILSFVFGLVAIIGKYLSGALRSDNLATLLNKFVIAVSSIAFYINKILFPVKLSCFYPYYVIGGKPFFLYSLVVFTVLVIAMILSSRYTRKVVFGGAFFLVAILPVLQLVPINLSIAADRYTYVSSIGLVYIIACGCVWVYTKRMKYTLWVNFFLSVLLITAIVTLSYLTWERCQVWRDDLTLWNDALGNYVNVDLIYNNRGAAYSAKGNYNQAIADYSKTIELNPNFFEAYDNRGIVYIHNGNYSQAILDFTKAIEINHKYANAYYNRAGAYVNINNYDKAISDFSKVIELEPGYCADAYYGRAKAYWAKQEYDKAWQDIHIVEGLGFKIDPIFFKGLEKSNVPQGKKSKSIPILKQ
ncbi:MAG: tetratricopeptide repeat protein [Candidatus Omnitrophota bacterium]